MASVSSCQTNAGQTRDLDSIVGCDQRRHDSSATT